MGKSKVKLIAAIAIAAVLGFSLILGALPYMLKVSNTQTPTPTTQTTSLPMSCDMPYVLISIYKGNSKLPSNVLGYVRDYFKQFIPKDQELSVCIIPWNSSMLQGKTLRAYPALAIKAENVSKELMDYFGERIGENIYIIKYPIVVDLASRYNVPVQYTYQAKAVLVQGESKYSRLDNQTLANKLKDLLSLIAVANVTDITLDNYTNYPDIEAYPAVLYSSNMNLSEQLPYLKQYSGMFLVDTKYALPLAGLISHTLGVQVYAEIHGKKPEVGVVIGRNNTPVSLIVFVDLACSFCAKLINETLPKLDSLVNEGKISVSYAYSPSPYMMREHALLQCYIKVTGDSSGYVKLIRTLAEKLLKERRTISESELKTLMNSIYGASLNYTELDVCANTTGTSIVKETISEASKLSITATPTIIVWNNRKNMGLIIEGYLPADELMKVIEAVSKLS